MNKATFRVDVLAHISQDIIEQRIAEALKDLKSEKYLISLEKADGESKKLHYQGIIFYDMKYETYKKRMEAFFPEWKGERGKKGARSFAEVRTDNYEIYVTKDYNFKFVKGYSKEEIDELYSKSYKKREVIDSGLPITGGKQELDTTLYKIYKDMVKIPDHGKWDMIKIGIFIQDYYLENYGKFPMDHFAKSLVKGLWVMANKHEQNYRKASIAYNWIDDNFKMLGCKPGIFEHLTDMIHADAFRHEKVVEWNVDDSVDDLIDPDT